NAIGAVRTRPPTVVTALRLVRGATTPPHIEPVSVGVPFARAAWHDAARLAAVDASGRPLATQAAALAHWPDGSVRWALFDILVDATGSLEEHVELQLDDGAHEAHDANIAVEQTAAAYRIGTGAIELAVPFDTFAPFSTLWHTSAAEAVVSSALALQADDALSLVPALTQLSLERAGGVRLTLAGSGEMRAADGDAFCRFAIR